MTLTDYILKSGNNDVQLQLNVKDLTLLTNCFSRHIESSDFVLSCLEKQSFESEPQKRVKRDENIMKKIVSAYSEVFGSHSKAQKK